MLAARQVPRLTWKWGGRTNPFKSGNSSSVANLEKIPIAADKMGTELEPAVHKFSENGCEKRFLFTTFVTIITWLSSPHLITAQLAWYITRISHFPRFCISPKHYFAFVWPWDRLHTIFTVYFSLFTACISTHDLFHWNGAILTHSGQFSS